MSESEFPQSSRPIRWRGLVIIGILTVIGFGVIEWMQHPSVQQKWMRQAVLGIVLITLAFVWFFFLSNLAVMLRKRCGLGLVALVLGFMAFFKYDGVSGDLFPIFSPRFGKSGPPPLATKESSATVAVPSPPGAADFTQFLGPNRNGKLSGPKLVRDWTKSPPKELWRKPVGQAWSGFAVIGGMAITQEQREDQELTVCYHLLTGEILWSHANKTRYDNPLGGVGPRATPTIANGKVFSQGATGILDCLDLNTGRLIWSKNIVESNGAEVPEWGVSGSPLIVGDDVIVAVGQANGCTLAAYHISDGTRIWMGGNQAASYSSPILTKVAGVEQLLYFGPKALAGFDPASGKLLWEHPWFPTSKFPHVAVPIPLDNDSIMISSGYGQGSSLAKISRAADGTWAAEETWSTNRMKAKFTNLIDYGGLIFGLDDGMFACFDPKGEGAIVWRDGRYGHGQTLLVDSVFLVMAEDGNVILVQPDPTGLKELTRAKLLTDKTWNPPTLAGKFLLVRNDHEAACFELSVEP